MPVETRRQKQEKDVVIIAPPKKEKSRKTLTSHVGPSTRASRRIKGPEKIAEIKNPDEEATVSANLVTELEPVAGPSHRNRKNNAEGSSTELTSNSFTSVPYVQNERRQSIGKSNIFDEQDWEKFENKKRQSKERHGFQFDPSSNKNDFLNPGKARAEFFEILQDYRFLHRMKRNINESVDRICEEPPEFLKERLSKFRLRKEKEAEADKIRTGKAPADKDVDKFLKSLF